MSKVANYLQLGKTQYAVILGLAVSGVSSIVSTYDYASKLDQKQKKCEESEDLKKALRTRFIVLMILSCLAVVIGVIIGIILRKNPKKLLTFGITTSGIFGIGYALFSYFQNKTTAITMGASWSIFFIFILLGIILEIKPNTKINFNDNIFDFDD